MNGNAATAIPHATHDMKTEVYMKVLKSFVRIVCYQENLQADVKVSPSYSFFKLEKLTVFFKINKSLFNPQCMTIQFVDCPHPHTLCIYLE